MPTPSHRSPAQCRHPQTSHSRTKIPKEGNFIAEGTTPCNS
ncbi:hypothetical protein [Microcoleus sp. FACHB-68]|nr:hypothetical protein [Microcoleus sp. FACHB-68]